MALVAFIGNAMLGNINSTLSPNTATGQQNGSSQNLSSNIVATATRGSGNYSYLWNYSGTVVTFTGQTNSTTNVSYASVSVAGSSTISCTVTDRTTGVVANTTNSCAITWPLYTTPITSVTWSIASNTTSQYNATAQSVTVSSVVPPGATYSTSTTTATNAGGVASTTITGTGSYSGSFTSPNLTIVAATISGTAANPSATYNSGSQSGTVITGVSPVGATFSGSVTASGTNAGTYTSSITGTGNYQGTVNGGTFTISARQLTINSFDQDGCDGNENGYYAVSISGIQGSDAVTLEAWIGDYNIGPQSVAPELPFAIGYFNGTCPTPLGGTGANPRNITNANLVGGIYYNGPYQYVLKKNDGDTGAGNTFYWIILYGNANYLSSGYIGPRGNYCGGG